MSIQDGMATRTLQRKSLSVCPKCNEKCLKEEGEIVRAFNHVYHYKCFICEDCQEPVAQNYYAITCEEKNRTSRKKLVVCEYHHLKRLGLICLKCNKPITTSEQKFHPQCIQCPLCVTPTVSQYEHKGTSYCRLHYSLIPDTHCNGCDQAILKQFVEHRDMPNFIWHPECYMIFKFWGIKLAPNPTTITTTTTTTNNSSNSSSSNLDVIAIQNQLHQKVNRVWTDLSSFEESSANCISDMLLNVAAGAYLEGIRMANQFIMHLHVLFSALDGINTHLHQNIDCHTEAHLVCQQMTRFFQLLTVPSKPDIGITQELLSLVTGLAQNLKSLIRIGLDAALHLERDLGVQNAIPQFLNQLLELEKKRVWIAGRYWFKDPPLADQDYLTSATAGQCNSCHLLIEDTDCYQNSTLHLRWHPSCFSCITCSMPLDENSALLNNATLYCQACCTTDAQTCTHVTLLQQYLYSLKLYLARLSSLSSSSTSTTFIGAADIQKKSSNDLIMPETKRQRSILRMLGHRTQQQPPKPDLNRLESVQLGQIQRTSSTTLEEIPKFANKKKSKKLVISTENTPCQTSPISPLPLSPGPMSSKTAKRLTSSIRRTFSTNTYSPTTRQRISLYGVFDRRKARRASVLTLDDAGRTKTKIIYLPTLTPMQDFIVRHVSLITIQPLLIPPHSLDELIDLIELNKKKKRHLDSNHHHHNPASALWSKLITHIKTSKTTTNTNNQNLSINKTFGVPLSILVIRDHQEQENEQGVTLCDFAPAMAACFSDNALIPIFVKSCIMAILQSDMSIEGVFRKNGNIRHLRDISETIDNTNSTQFERLISSENPVQLASLLKRFLRELPEPLMTFSLYKLFVECGKTLPQRLSSDRKKLLHLACCLLPKPNRDTMLLLFTCLKWVATFSDDNKMDIHNLACVIAPSILYDKASRDARVTADLRNGAREEINVIETLIREVDQLSVVPSDLTLLSLQDNVNQDTSDLNSRYFIRHYTQLLADLNNRKSKSENNSPVSATGTSKKLTQSSLLLKHQIGVPKAKDITTTPTKGRRTSWIPGLAKK
ncbi:hypothetical protein HPULCUR_011270 [Helicostylum pulchrum]|uniref:RhoGAP-domain-containing protein n=1 Tax=Helicostylum pulchrum TaxID=562976 RepID=A0ABP9YGG5_9FUNG